MGLGTTGVSGLPGGPRGTGGRGPGSGDYQEINDVKDVVKVSSSLGGAGMIFSAGETTGAPDASAPATVPYSEVYPTYHKAAEDALRKESIPPIYRNRVKEYFSSLE